MEQNTSTTPQEVPGAELAFAIHQLYQTTDNNERKDLMDKFTILEGAPENHIRNVLTLLTKGDDTEEGQKITHCKMSLTVYLKNFGNTVAKDSMKAVKAKATSPENILQKKQQMSLISNILSLFIEACLSPTLSQKFKNNFNIIVNRLLYTCQMLDSSDKQTDFQIVLGNFLRLILGGLQQVNHFETQVGAIALCENFFSVLTPATFEQAFESLAQPLRGMAEFNIANFKADMLQVQSQMPLDQVLSASNPLAVRMTNSLEVLYHYADMLQKVFDKYETKNYMCFDYFARSESIMSVFAALLGLTANQAGPHAQSVISFSGLQKLDQILNKTKTKVLESMRTLSTFIFEHKKASEAKLCPFVPKTQSLAPILIQSAILFATDPNLASLVTDEDYSDLVVELIEMLVILCAEMIYYDTFAAKQVEIIISLCMNLMQTMNEEAECIISDPSEFVNLALDCTDKQKSLTMKTQSCKMLEAMCDNIDGTTRVITTFSVNALNVALNRGETPQFIASEGLWNMDQDPFLQRTDPIIVAETCLVALTVIAYSLPKRADLLPYFQAALAQNIEKILTPIEVPADKAQDAMEIAKSVILRARMSLLLGYYADIMFIQQSGPFKMTMEFLFKSIGYSGAAEKVIALQSVDTLNTVVTDSDLAPRLVPLLPNILEILGSLTPVITFPTYFEFLFEFQKFYAPALENQILHIFQSVVQRILSEQANLGSKSEVVIGKCWNIIRSVCESKKYMPLYYDQIEAMLMPLFQLMIDPTKISFDEDIVLVLKSLIKKKNAVSPTLWEIFPKLPKVLEKQKHSFSNLLDTLNHFLIIGQADLAANENNLKVVADMADTALFSTLPQQTINNAEGAILIQLIFQIMKGTDCLNNIFEAILNRVVEKMRAIGKSDDFNILKKHLLGVFMSAVAYNSTATMRYLEQNEMTSDLVLELFKIKGLFKHSYERKLFIIGLSGILQCPVLPESLRPLFVQLLQEVMAMIKAEQDARIKEVRKQTKKDLKENGKDDDDSDEEDYDEDEDEELYSGEDDDGDSQLGDDDSQGAVDGGSKKYPLGAEEDLGFVNKVDDDEGDGKMEDEEIEESKEESKAAAQESSDDGEAFGSDDEAYLDESFDLVVTMDMLTSPFKSINGHEVFCDALKTLSHRSPDDMNNILSQLTEEQKKLVSELYQSKAVTIQNKNGEQHQVTRRIITVRRKKPAAGDADQSQTGPIKKQIELPPQK